MAALVVGTAVGLLVGWWSGWLLGLLCGIAALHAAFVVSGWLVLWPMDATATRLDHHQDLDPMVDEVVVVVVAVGALVAIGIVLVLGGSERQGWAAGVALLGVFMAWASLHLLYGVRYARMYYLEPGGGGSTSTPGTTTTRPTATSSTSATPWA